MTENNSPFEAIHVLVVDDDPDIRQLIIDYLGDNQIRVFAAENGSDMKHILAQELIDLIILDLKLPGEDGMMLARSVRAESDIPIVILTGKKDEADRIMGLELCADDYLTKPFSPRELLARIRALLRRSRLQETLVDGLARIRAYRFGGWELNIRLRRLTAPNGAIVVLTNTEFNLLVAFLDSPRKVLTREKLLELSRLHNAEVYDRAIDVQVGRLRKKIEPADGAANFIQTERGQGYCFAVDTEIVR